MKECQEHYKFSFKVDEYNFTIKQITDEKFKMEINNKDFMDLMKEERTGEFQRKKKEYLSSKEKEKKKNNNTEDDYYRKTIKYNGENYFEGEEDMYDIEEQRKRLEEFERKKKKINNEDDDFYGSKKMNNGNKFILDNKTVNTNRMIICNLKDIFGEDNFGNEVQGDEFNFSWGDNGDDNNYIFKQNKNNRNNFIQDSIFNNNNNNGNNNPIYDKKILESNPDYYLNQMSNNLNNANNPHNQAVLNQFLNFNDQNGNNNNPYNIKPLLKEGVKCKLSEITDISTKINVEITISDPLVNEGGIFSKSYVTYLVKTKPFNFEVRRRFSDFEWLHNILMAQYVNCIIPPLFKKTSLKIISGGNKDDLIINKRINIIDKFMKELITHPLLRNSQILYDFISIKDEKTFNNKKNIYNKLKTPQRVEEVKTLNGIMDIGVDKEKEQLAEKIKVISESNGDLMKKLTKEYKLLNTQIEEISKKMKDIAKIWDELYKKGESNSESEIILGLYDIMYKVMEDWSNMEKNHVKLINLKIREFFRYMRYEYKSIREYYNTYDNAKNQYLKSYIKLMDNKEKMFREEDIENWGLSQEDMKNKMNLLKNKEYSIERMLPEETKKVNDFRKMYGCYLNSLVGEYKEIQNYNGTRHKENISKFMRETTENYSKFHVSITNLIAYIDALKEDNFK